MREEKDKEGERWKGEVGEEMERNGSKERERVTQNSSYYVFTNSQ